MATINLVLWDNGVGLTRDMELLRELWRAAGYDVFVSARRRGTLRKWLAPWRLKARIARQRWRGDDPAGRFAFNVMLEHILPEYLDLGRQNVLIPNPEWFGEESRKLIDRIDLVLTKTHHAEALFESLGSRTRFLGFTSVDRCIPGAPERDGFLSPRRPESPQGNGCAAAYLARTSLTGLSSRSFRIRAWRKSARRRRISTIGSAISPTSN